VGRKIAAVAALMSLWILPARAQSRAGAHAVASSSAVSSRPARNIPSPVRPVTARTPIATSASVHSTSSFSAGTLQNLLGCPVAGFESDAHNWAALNGNLAVRALIDPVTQYEVAQAVRQCGAFASASAYFYPAFGPAPIVMETPMAAAPADPAPQQPTVVVVPPAEEQPPSDPDPPVVEEQPLPDPGEFVLVQRDGRLLFAAGFTAAPGRVVYVTKEGLRRSIALDQLDVEATLRMNEECGSSIQLPKA
jgi:hypothetical protein